MTRMTVTGRGPHSAGGRPAIIASNHLSFVDSMVIPLASGRRSTSSGKPSTSAAPGSRAPSSSRGCGRSGTIPVEGRTRGRRPSPCTSPSGSSPRAARSGSIPRAPGRGTAAFIADAPAWRGSPWTTGAPGSSRARDRHPGRAASGGAPAAPRQGSPVSFGPPIDVATLRAQFVKAKLLRAITDAVTDAIGGNVRPGERSGHYARCQRQFLWRRALIRMCCTSAAIAAGKLAGPRLAPPGRWVCPAGTRRRTPRPRHPGHALGRLPGGIVVVTGTNGRTTTTRMLVALLRAHGKSVFTNPTGSNFHARRHLRAPRRGRDRRSPGRRHRRPRTRRGPCTPIRRRRRPDPRAPAPMSPATSSTGSPRSITPPSSWPSSPRPSRPGGPQPRRRLLSPGSQFDAETHCRRGLFRADASGRRDFQLVELQEQDVRFGDDFTPTAGRRRGHPPAAGRRLASRSSSARTVPPAGSAHRRPSSAASPR